MGAIKGGFSPSAEDQGLMKERFWWLLCLIPLFLAALPGRAPSRSSSPAAAPTAWTEIGPFGGDIRGLARNPSSTKEFYAVSIGGQVHKTADSGASWRRVAFLDVLDDSLQDVACGPAGTSVVTALGEKSLFTSSDGGQTWTRTPFPGSCSAEGGRVALHPRDSRVLYVAGRYTASGKDHPAILKSENGGRTWLLIKPGGAVVGRASFVVVSAANPAVVYAGGLIGTGAPCILKSPDSGRSWQNITGSVAGTPYELVLDPAEPQKIYVATDQGVFRSPDGGRTWLRNNGTAYGTALAIDPAHPNILYTSYLALGVYKSVNGGIDWICRRIESDTSSRRLLVAGNGVYLACTAGIWKSGNAGATWRQSDSGIRAASVTALAVASSSARILFAADPNRGIVRSQDGGRTWETRSVRYGCASIPGISIHPRDPNTAWIIEKAG
jgi:photosystem II stability/assembly factor-like uncharacterized protein